MDTKEKNWHVLDWEKALTQLTSQPEGLSEDEAKLRRIRFGFNELPRKKRMSKLQIVLGQFKSALVYILLMAAFISFFLGDHIDVYVILFAILINVIVGYIQENKAQNALEKLNSLVVQKTKVLRDGVAQMVLARDIVPGDILNLEPGDRITADARLIKAVELQINEAALTGESNPVEKQLDSLLKGTVLAERSNMVYSGTAVIKGRGLAVVTATGVKTQIGQIAGMLQGIKEELTPLQKKLDGFSRYLSVIVLLVSLLIFVLGVFTGQGFVVMFNTAVAVAVAAIPEGLLVAVTVILALGMQSILKKKALVRRLIAAETLGSTTVICTDKTGTITEGRMMVAEAITDSSEVNVMQSAGQIKPSTLAEAYLMIQIGVLCNDAVIKNEEKDLREWEVLGSGTETALLLTGAQIGLKQQELARQYPRLDELVFNSERKFMATLHRQDKGGRILYFKGAPEVILSAATHFQQGDRTVKIYKDKREEFIKKYQQLSRKGLRVLSFAYRKVPDHIQKINQIEEEILSDLVWVGFVGIKDPLRPEVVGVMKETALAGIKTVMITGDNKITARTIAAELGIPADDGSIMEGADLLKLDDDSLLKKVDKIKIYARVTPGDKLRIVKAWQKRGEVVAMTGDGVNDAPALKQADVGVALGSGSDVAKEAADLVLLNNAYGTIVAAIEQGRVIYDNIKKVVLYLLSDSFSEVILIIGSIVFKLPLPLLPVQILWINLITDGPAAMSLTVEPEEPEIMNDPPQERNKPILDFERKLLIVIISLITGISTLGIFYYFANIVGDLALARTVSFAVLGIDSLLYVFSCRTLRHSIFHSHFFKNKFLIWSVFLGIALQAMAIYMPLFQGLLRTVPLGLREWSVVAAACLLVILAIEIVKWIFIARHKK